MPMCFPVSLYVHKQAHTSASKLHPRLARELGQEVLGQTCAETEGLADRY